MGHPVENGLGGTANISLEIRGEYVKKKIRNLNLELILEITG